MLHAIFRVLPPRLIFAISVIMNEFSVRGRTAVNSAFTPIVVRCLDKNPRFRLTSSFTNLFPGSEIFALHSVGAHQEVVDVMTRRGNVIVSQSAAATMARSLLELGELKRARTVLNAAFSREQVILEPGISHLKGLLEISTGDAAESLVHLAVAAKHMPSVARPHHNLAARLGGNYTPNALDEKAGDLGRVFDAANYMGQRVTHIGRGELSAGIYKLALDVQKKLNKERSPRVSKELQSILEEHDISFDDMRIFPEEWCTRLVTSVCSTLFSGCERLDGGADKR